MSEQKTIVIFVDGGVVQSVASDAQNVRVIVIDSDDDGSEITKPFEHEVVPFDSISVIHQQLIAAYDRNDGAITLTREQWAEVLDYHYRGLNSNKSRDTINDALLATFAREQDVRVVFDDFDSYFSVLDTIEYHKNWKVRQDSYNSRIRVRRTTELPA